MGGVRRQLHFDYDAKGNRTSFRKREGSTLTYAYDNLNRLTSKIVAERRSTPATATRDVYFGYDARASAVCAL